MIGCVLAVLLGAAPRVVVWQVHAGEGVEGKTADAITEALTAEVRRRAGGEVVTQREIATVLSLEQQKQVLGCQSDSCMVELAGALGVERLVAGDLARLGESWLFHLKLMDAGKAKVFAQADRRLRGGSIDDVLDVLPGMVTELFPGALPPPAAAAAERPSWVPPASGAARASTSPAPPEALSWAPPASAAPAPGPPAPLFPPAPAAAAPEEGAPLPAPTAPMPPPGRAKVPRSFAEATTIVPLADRAGLTVYSDERGHYLAAAPLEAATRPVFAGTKKKLFLQEVVASGADGSSTHGFAFWDPRATREADAVFEVRDGEARVRCGGSEAALKPLPRAEASKILTGATFYKPRWLREAHALAGDDEGNLFYVDRARGGAGRAGRGADYRLFAGPKGALTHQEIVDIAGGGGDSLILITASGRLKLGRAADGRSTAEWTAGDGRRVLRVLDVSRDGALVHRDPGVYGGEPVGTPCDAVP